MQGSICGERTIGTISSADGTIVSETVDGLISSTNIGAGIGSGVGTGGTAVGGGVSGAVGDAVGGGARCVVNSGVLDT